MWEVHPYQDNKPPVCLLAFHFQGHILVPYSCGQARREVWLFLLQDRTLLRHEALNYMLDTYLGSRQLHWELRHSKLPTQLR